MSDQVRHKPYAHPAGGWGALNATARALREQSVVGKGSKALLSMNKPDGFKCPSCAWPEPDRVKTFEFCENGAKALAAEATRKRVSRALFEQNSVRELALQSDYWLEEQGRLTEPMRYDPASDHYVPCSWDQAFAEIGAALRALADPNEAEFYTSGRTSNEAAFLYSVFVREYGTNNFPDCSNMCHEPTSRGLPASIGIGKGTVVITDFATTEAIFILGQNTGTNSPRMMTELVAARKRGVPIVVFNPMPERALLKFTEPQDPAKMATFGSTKIASEFCHIRIGGDVAALKGVMKALLETPEMLDQAFIQTETHGFEALAADMAAASWPEIESVSGLSEAQIRRVAAIYANSNATIICYGMGITQHVQGARAVQQIANLLMLRGNFSKKGAGICPVRGHSNVQGDRTVGIDEKPPEEMLKLLEKTFGFKPASAHGHHVVDAVRAMMQGRSKIFIGLGGNFIHAIPDTPISYQAMRNLEMTVAITTKLNRGHIVHGRKAFLLPCLARSEFDEQKTGRQTVSIEDSMSNVLASKGILEPASPHLLSEIDIVCRLADATLPNSPVPWKEFVADYDLIRDKIALVYPKLFEGYNEKLRQPHGFHLYNGARHRDWKTPTGKANFLIFEGLAMDPPVEEQGMLRLATVRSHDQFNTTIYSNNDRYRGIAGGRMVLFMNGEEMAARGLVPNDIVALETIADDGVARSVGGLTLVAYPLPHGAVAGYYPELNPLLPLGHHDEISGTPAAKSIPVRVMVEQKQALAPA